ncbi:hypothetical protein C5L38_35070 (plasmid) [Streptomyces sp. WAC00288]|nr:hypothetical protein C5L38_35070 [Streptomyces sp. WAC00288]
MFEDDPKTDLLPAPAGMDPRHDPAVLRGLPAPCARGDGPAITTRLSLGDTCSPRSRGWTQQVRADRPRHVLLSAFAGMDPSPPTRWTAPRPAPCACGDEPSWFVQGPDLGFCSLRLRGCVRFGEPGTGMFGFWCH